MAQYTGDWCNSAARQILALVVEVQILRPQSIQITYEFFNRESTAEHPNGETLIHRDGRFAAAPYGSSNSAGCFVNPALTAASWLGDPMRRR